MTSHPRSGHPDRRDRLRRSRRLAGGDGDHSCRWRIVANGPIADAYSYAVATDVPNPGKDEAVVTDANILDAVTAIVAPAAVEE